MKNLKRKIREGIVVILLLSTIGMFVTAQASYYGYKTFQLTNGTVFFRNPKISDDKKIVWEGAAFNGSTSDIYLYSSNYYIPLTNTPNCDESNPYISKNGRFVVWQGCRNITINSTTTLSTESTDTKPTEIVLYDCYTNDYKVVSKSGFINSQPKVNSYGQAVWEALPRIGGDKKVFFYNGNYTFEIANISAFEPEINEEGSVIFTGKTNLSDEIFLYSNDTLVQLTDDYYSDRQPRINNVGETVWIKSKGGYSDLFLYKNGNFTQLTSYDKASNPTINDLGQIAWEGLVNNTNLTNASEIAIYFYDGYNDTYRISPDYIRDSYSPKINNRGQVVWYGTKGELNITSGELNTTHHGIFLYVDANNGVTQLGGLADNLYPEINTNGVVTWYAKDIENLTSQIFLSIPIQPPQAPSDLVAVADKVKKTVTLTWKDNSYNEDGFRVERKLDTNPYVVLAKLPPNTTTWIDTTIPTTIPQSQVTASSKLYYRVSAFNEDGYSGYSNVASPACFIATAAYGSDMAKDVNTLRKLRDQYLIKNPLGKKFIELYYRYSPSLAEFISDKPVLKAMVRFLLKPLVWLSEKITK